MRPASPSQGAGSRSEPAEPERQAGRGGQSRGSGEPPASLCFPVAPFSLSDAGSGASGAGPASRHAQGQRPPQPHSAALPEASGLADD